MFPSNFLIVVPLFNHFIINYLEKKFLIFTLNVYNLTEKIPSLDMF
jgi:hypothetical protein